MHLCILQPCCIVRLVIGTGSSHCDMASHSFGTASASREALIRLKIRGQTLNRSTVLHIITEMLLLSVTVAVYALQYTVGLPCRVSYQHTL